MKKFIIVRTDLINPHTYLEAEMNYKELLEILEQVGGYALYQQIYSYYGERSKGYREINKMQELLLVGSEKLNNNRYIYLKISALRYLKYREIEDIEDMSVNRKPVKPGYRPLLNSIYSFENFLENKVIINTDVSTKVLDKVIEKCRQALKINRIPNIHLVKLENDKNVQDLKTAVKILGDRTGIYLTSFQEEKELSSSVLEFTCYDFDQELEENTVLRCLRLISNFIGRIATKNKTNYFNFSIEIITLSESKKEVLQGLEEEALTSFNNRGIRQSKNNSLRKGSGIRDISYKVLPNIERYTDITNRGESEFAFIDNDTVDRLEELKDILKGVEKKDED